MQTRDNVLQEELTTLTGLTYFGDPTPIIYEMLKDTEDKDALIGFLLGGTNNVDNNKSCTFVRKESSNGFSVEEWLSRCEEL